MNPHKKDPPLKRLKKAKDLWQAFGESAKSHAASIESDKPFFTELLQIWAYSDFISKACLRSPDMLMDLYQRQHVMQAYETNFYAQELTQLLADMQPEISADPNATLPLLQAVLRKFRRRELVRIAWRDLVGRATLADTMADLSAFANTCVDAALSVLYDIQCQREGVPRSKTGARQHLVVFALGKLGGRELNFSSDIDLIFAYPEAGQTDHPKRSYSNDVFFVRLCRNVIKALSEITADGQVFRVDMRLRPDGENGPMVTSFDNMVGYYQTHGREWERYAWIKGRAIAGDKTAAESLRKRLRPFIYRRYLDYGAFDSLRDMKRKISVEVKRKGMANNIKLGPGGIREIEFFGQVFQLIRGGVTAPLQDQRILFVLDALVQERYIDPETRNELRDAYCFLRTVEHRLQEFSDQQTHDLPADPDALHLLARSMGFEDGPSFLNLLKQHRQRAQLHFDNLLAPGHPENDLNCSEEDNAELACLWEDTSADEQACEDLAKAGFQTPEATIKLLTQYKNSPETRALSREGRIKVDRLIPIVLKATAGSPQPDLVLKRIISLIDTIQRRTNYVSLLLENPNALAHLIQLAHASPWIITYLSRHPVLLDELIDPRTLYSPPEKEDMQTELQRRLSIIAPDDLEYQIEALCIFRQVHELRVAAADITDVLPLMRVSDYLSEIAEIVLQEVVNLSWQHLVAKHGAPTASLKGHACKTGFAVIAYGKLGGLELGYGSDLDMVFIHAGERGQTDGERPIENGQFFARLGQRVVHLLTTHTAAGRIYEIDMRLRPSGSSGLLVSHYDSFQSYQNEDAWTWEHQALLRTRAIVGDANLTNWFNDVRQAILIRKRDKSLLQQDVIKMRQKMRQELAQKEYGRFDIKQDPGGIVDIEFLVQYLVLLHAHQHPALVAYSDNVRQIRALAETGILDEKVAHLLRRIYLVYRATVHRLNLAEKPHLVPQETFQDLRRHVDKMWFFYMGENIAK